MAYGSFVGSKGPVNKSVLVERLRGQVWDKYTNFPKEVFCAKTVGGMDNVVLDSKVFVKEIGTVRVIA